MKGLPFPLFFYPQRMEIHTSAWTEQDHGLIHGFALNGHHDQHLLQCRLSQPFRGETGVVFQRTLNELCFLMSGTENVSRIILILGQIQPLSPKALGVYVVHKMIWFPGVINVKYLWGEIKGQRMGSISSKCLWWYFKVKRSSPFALCTPNLAPPVTNTVGFTPLQNSLCPV